MDKPSFHRSPTHHTITCSCCQDTIRVPTRRRFLCDNCFHTGPSRKSEPSFSAFGRKLTEWLVHNGLMGEEMFRPGWEARHRDLPFCEHEESHLSAYIPYTSREKGGNGA